MILKHNGCPAHFEKTVRDYLNQKYPNRWIDGRGKLLDWLSRSSDLLLKDFFHGEHLKSVCYKTPLNSIEKLKQRTTESCENLSPVTFHSMRKEFLHLIFYEKKF